MDLSHSLLVKQNITQEQEVFLLALSTVAYSHIVRLEYITDPLEETYISVEMVGHPHLLSMVNSVLRKVTRLLEKHLLEFAPSLTASQKSAYSLGVAAGVLAQAAEVDSKRNYLNAFEQSVEKARSEQPELTSDISLPMPVTSKQVSGVLDVAKRSDPMFYGLGLKLGNSLSVYEMFVDKAKELNVAMKRKK